MQRRECSANELGRPEMTEVNAREAIKRLKRKDYATSYLHAILIANTLYYTAGQYQDQQPGLGSKAKAKAASVESRHNTSKYSFRTSSQPSRASRLAAPSARNHSVDKDVVSH